jgi:capsid protein
MSNPRFSLHPVGQFFGGFFGGLRDGFQGRGYDGGEVRYGDRGRDYSRSGQFDEDRYVTQATRDELCKNLMDARRNDPLVKACCSRIVDFSAGPVGLIAQATTNTDAINTEYDQYFKEWCRRPDFLGRMTFGDFQRVLIDVDEYAGDCLIVRLANGQIQGIEGEHIRQPKTTPPTRACYEGLRLNATGQVIAFCVNKRNDKGEFTGQKEGVDFEWIPASDVFHWTDQWRFDSIRALPELACGVVAARDIHDANDGTLKQIRGQAKPIFATETYSGSMPLTGRSQAKVAPAANRDRIEEVGTATIMHFLQGEGGLKPMSPATPNANFKPFLEFNMRRFCAVTGFAYEFVMIDLTGGNFSRDRTAKAITQRAIDRKQARLVRFCDHVRSWQIARGVARKEIAPAPVVNGRSQFADCQWIPPPQDWADADDQVSTDMKEIQSGLSSYTEKLSRKQKDYEEVLRAKAAEIVLRKKIAAEFKLDPDELGIIALPGAAPAAPPPAKGNEK